MRNLIFGLFLLGFIAAGNSQILLEEAKVVYRPESMKIDPATNSLTITIPEKVVGEFQQDPLNFMKARFDSKKFIEDNKDLKFVGVDVMFKSRKGHLLAHFDSKGDLISSNQQFKNVRLPNEARQEISRLYQNAVVKQSKYFAHSDGWDITKEYYKVKIKEGNKNKTVRINKDKERISIAGL